MERSRMWYVRVAMADRFSLILSKLYCGKRMFLMNLCLICVMILVVIAGANVVGKLLNTCSDVAPNTFSGDIFKRIDSGELISAKILYRDIITITNYTRMIFCLNELPKTNNRSNGYFRRFLIAPFKVQIPKSRIDPKLANTQPVFTNSYYSIVCK